ncbi:rhodanese-like domain-containing protein [Halobium palmae]|uniref:Rhodanese-like domain-containing protein n=1 Tax=Halobium palmae TaxID=1776492 RepID=A0ABD5RTW6_9EURY
MSSSGDVTRGSQQILKGYQELLVEAKRDVKVYSIEEALDRYLKDDATFVDVRDAPELWKDGQIPGSVHASRGMLEFHIDPTSPYYMDEFGKETEYIFVCAVGGRSALAAHRAKEMGLSPVATLEGGYKGWKDYGAPVDEAQPMM